MLQENVREYIALKIKEFRESMGWTKSRLAVTLDTTPRMITNWEQGRGLPSIEYVYDMALIFGVGVEEFFPPIVIKTENDMEKEIVSDFRKLNPEGKMIALASVKGFSHMAKFRNALVK